MITMYDKNGKFHLDAKDKAILQKCVYENQYIPFNPFPKQAEMILATEKEVLIGGAAGGSKSTSLLMRALFYVQDDANEYHALILRRTLSDLKRKGALIHKASQWLNRKEVQNNASIKPKWDETEHSWTFPNGNSLTFGYYANSYMKLVKMNQKLHNPDSPLLIEDVKDGETVKEISEPSYIDAQTRLM